MCRSNFNTQEKLKLLLLKVRGYKKDYDDCRKKLYKAEEDFAYEKNREMLMGAQLDVHVDFIKEEKGHRGK